MFKCRISGVRKKKWELKEKLRKKNQSVCSGNFAKFVFTGWAFYVNLQVRVTGKKSFKVFSGWVFEVEIAICWEKGKVSWASC
jgi:hypothetical protein